MLRNDTKPTQKCISSNGHLRVSKNKSTPTEILREAGSGSCPRILWPSFRSASDLIHLLSYSPPPKNDTFFSLSASFHFYLQVNSTLSADFDHSRVPLSLASAPAFRSDQLGLNQPSCQRGLNLTLCLRFPAALHLCCVFVLCVQRQNCQMPIARACERRVVLRLSEGRDYCLFRVLPAAFLCYRKGKTCIKIPVSFKWDLNGLPTAGVQAEFLRASVYICGMETISLRCLCLSVQLTDQQQENMSLIQDSHMDSIMFAKNSTQIRLK